MTDTTKPREHPAMTDIKDNQPPLTEEEKALGAFLAAMKDCNHDGLRMRQAMLNVLGVSAEKAAMQGELEQVERLFSEHVVAVDQKIDDLVKENDELRAKLKALEEQKPVAELHIVEFEDGDKQTLCYQKPEVYDLLVGKHLVYTAAGAKE